jgi:hypothetical protein
LRFPLTLLFLIVAGKSVYAFGGSRGERDSLLPVRYSNSQNEEVRAELLDVEAIDRSTGDSRKAFAHLLKIWRRRNAIRDRKIRVMLFNDLAGISARLKLYPLAMKCYYKAVREPEKLRYLSPELTSDVPDSVADIDSLMAGASAQQWTYADTVPGVQAYPGSVIPSEPVRGQDVRESFNDGKTVSFYAILVHVKQPVPGTRKSFTHINNVGHMFITLIKYNGDNSFVCRSFGFYPKKSTILSATPLHPGSASVFKDDALHEWDEVAGKFITFRTFRKVIDAMAGYDQRAYHLNRNNCTDFGLSMARIGGISIADAAGRWPLGRGNNPGNAGQSMLEGKVSNIDTDYQQPLFVSTNRLGWNH